MIDHDISDIITRSLDLYYDTVVRCAYMRLGNIHDAEDAAQDVFVAFMTAKKRPRSDEHIKAWLLRVAINQARDMSRSFFRKNSTALEDYMETLEFQFPEDRGLFEAVMGLPEKYRVVLHLYYFEDYSVKETAALLSVTEGSVKTRLSRARAMLKEILREDWADDDKF